MPTPRAYYENNSMLLEWEIRDEGDESAVTSGLTVEAKLFEAGTSTAIKDTGGSSINPISMSHQENGVYQGYTPDDADLSSVDEVDIQFTASGGKFEAAEWWLRSVPVKERNN